MACTKFHTNQREWCTQPLMIWHLFTNPAFIWLAEYSAKDKISQILKWLNIH